MNKRNLIYTGLLMLAMVTSQVSAKETSVSVVHGTANFNEGNAYCDSGKSESIHAG